MSDGVLPLALGRAARRASRSSTRPSSRPGFAAGAVACGLKESGNTDAAVVVAGSERVSTRPCC